MFGKNLKNKIAGLEYELDAADAELERAQAQLTKLHEERGETLHKMNARANDLTKANEEIVKLKERLGAASRGNNDLQKSLDDAIRRQEAAVKHEQAALTDWSRLTVWILDHAPADIIHDSAGSTVDLAIALLTRWMPAEDQQVVDADVVDEIADGVIEDNSQTQSSDGKIAVKYVNPDVKKRR